MTTNKAVHPMQVNEEALMQGVVPLVCSCCHTIVGVENHAAWEQRRQAEAHYFCMACLALPEEVIEQRLADATQAEAVWDRVASWILRNDGQAGGLVHGAGACWAYDEESGVICGQPATSVDLERGFVVCERHRKESTQ